MVIALVHATRSPQIKYWQGDILTDGLNFVTARYYDNLH
jgi:hypothetical protein